MGMWFTNNGLENCINTQFSFQGTDWNFGNFKKPETSTTRRREPGKLTLLIVVLRVGEHYDLLLFFFHFLLSPFVHASTQANSDAEALLKKFLVLMLVFVCSFVVCFLGSFCKKSKKFSSIFHANRNTLVDVSCPLQHDWGYVFTWAN